MGGPRRLRHTIPPIAFAALHIARKEAASRVWPAFCPGGAFEHQLTGLPYCGCMEVSVEGVLQANSHIVIFMGCWRVLS